jgi:23S rRNA (adenine-N6)-dimethyltransferase
LAPPDLVFELGAGDGILTAVLARRCRRVVAIEIDRPAWAQLKRRVQGNSAVTPVLGDMLAYEFPHRARYKIIANLPYAATSQLLRKLLHLANQPAETYLILALDAAQRWLGLGHDSVASIQLKARFEVEVVLSLHRREFAPRPNVDAVVARLVPGRDRPWRTNGAFDGFVRVGFGAGRRTAVENLARLMSGDRFQGVAAARGFDVGARPHELAIDDWTALYFASRGEKAAGGARRSTFGRTRG